MCVCAGGKSSNKSKKESVGISGGGRWQMMAMADCDEQSWAERNHSNASKHSNRLVYDSQ